jgi:hypothetical protein
MTLVGVLITRVAASVAVCHKANGFSAAHNIWLVDDV